MLSLFKELRRRRVFRVAGIYGVAAWVITEVASVVMPALLLPEWTTTFVIVLLVLGFPIAMLLAWAFDIGIERTAPRPTQAVPHGRRLQLFGYLTLLVLATLVLVLALYPDGPRALLADTRQALASLTAAAPPTGEVGERDSIAVLPFANISNDPDNDYFSDGMSEELLNLLAQVPGLKVAARTSSFAYRQSQKDIRTIASELGVQTVLEGSVRRAGNRVRITAQLIDAQTGYHLWSETYDRSLEDIFAVQDEISSSIVRALRIALASETTEAAPLREAPPTTDLMAYQLYLKGRHDFKRRGADAVRRSIDQFQQAIERDPNFARAHSALAAAYTELPGYGNEAPDDAFGQAQLAGVKALSLEDTLGEAHAVLAQINAANWDWRDAKDGFFFAISLDANDPTARQWYSQLLLATGRLDEALAQAQAAYELDPASPVANSSLARAHAWLGQDGEASRLAQVALELGYDTADRYVRLLLACRADDRRRAIGELEALGADMGIDREQAGAIVDEMLDRQSSSPVAPALVASEARPAMRLAFVLNAMAGRAEPALTLAADLATDKTLALPYLWLPEAAPLRAHPAFAGVLDTVGLDDPGPVAGGR